MDPRGVAGEFLDEHGAGNGATAFAAADVLDIGDGALDEFAVLIVEGHLPHFFAGSFGAGEQLVREGLVGAEHADVDIGEGDNDGPGQCSGVNEMCGAELPGVMDAIGEDEAALCVGIQHFDSLARHGGLNVAGLLRATAGHVFGAGHHANYLDVWL